MTAQVSNMIDRANLSAESLRRPTPLLGSEEATQLTISDFGVTDSKTVLYSRRHRFPSVFPASRMNTKPTVRLITYATDLLSDVCYSWPLERTLSDVLDPTRFPALNLTRKSKSVTFAIEHKAVG